MFISLKKVTKSQSIDTGMALVLICLLLANIFFKITTLNYSAIAILVITMSIPSLFKPIAVIWFGLSHALGTVVSKILLSVIFFVLVTPIGKLVSLFRKDPMKLRDFKMSTESVFKVRNHVFSKQDLEHPF